MTIFISSNIFCEDWIIAGKKFSLKQTKNSSDSVRKAAEVLPQLILEQISVGKLRVIPNSEILDRKLNELQTERLSLFLQLSKEVKTRDSLVISKIKPKDLEKAIVEAEKKIAEIQEQINENIQKADEEIAKFEKPLEEKKENNVFEKFSNEILTFFRKDEEEKIVTENVKLYKDDANTLFTPSDSANEAGIKSYEFSKELLNSKINGLITGTISTYGDYAGVTVEIFSYPGAKSIGQVTDVGTLTDLVSLAKRLVQSLSPKIANSFPVLVDFEIKPENAKMSSIVTIDGVVYSKLNEPVLLDSGIHTISIEAKGFEPLVLTYLFAGQNRFEVKGELIPDSAGEMNIRLKKFLDGTFYANAINSSKFGYFDDYAKLSVNGKNVLSIFEDSYSGQRAFIRIPFDLAQDGNNLVVNAKPFDRAANIDKRRRWMYIAYSSLICSLPFTFYSLGEFTSLNNAYSSNSKNVDYNELQSWQTRSNITQGISIACGVWFAVEMVRYLWAANQVLPAQAKKDKHPEKRLVFTLFDKATVEMNKETIQTCEDVLFDSKNIENNENIKDTEDKKETDNKKGEK